MKPQNKTAPAPYDAEKSWRLHRRLVRVGQALMLAPHPPAIIGPLQRSLDLDWTLPLETRKIELRFFFGIVLLAVALGAGVIAISSMGSR